MKLGATLGRRIEQNKNSKRSAGREVGTMTATDDQKADGFETCADEMDDMTNASKIPLTPMENWTTQIYHRFHLQTFHNLTQSHPIA